MRMSLFFHSITGLFVNLLIGGTVLAQSINTTNMLYPLKRAVENFPVTLYTTDNCAPCQSGRALLKERGVPFIEKTITTSADMDALRARQLENNFPVLTVGSRSVAGYQPSAWQAVLDFADYPKKSLLPQSYNNPQATPLVAAEAAKNAPSTPDKKNVPTPPTTTKSPNRHTDSATGIRF